MKRRYTGILLIVILVIIAGSIMIHIMDQRGSVAIGFTLPDRQGLSATLNNKPFSVTGLQATYRLKPGSYTLSVKKLDYKTLTTSFTVHTNQTTVLTVAPQRSTETPLSNWQQVLGSASYPPEITLTVNQYFYQDTWAVGVVEIDGGDNAFVVLRYNDSLQVWEIAEGPGTSFTTKELKSLPPAVAIYMQNNGSINAGG